jgi:hypothetical protein
MLILDIRTILDTTGPLPLGREEEASFLANHSSFDRMHPCILSLPTLPLRCEACMGRVGLLQGEHEQRKGRDRILYPLREWKQRKYCPLTQYFYHLNSIRI